MSNKEYRTDKQAPSSMFVNALYGNGHGAAELTCEWCNRLHLCPTSRSYTEDEDEGASWQEYCESEFAKNPAGVVLHWDEDAVTAQQLNGMYFVIDCPCNGLTRYETFIWAEKDTIRRYLKVRIQHEYELAEQQLTINRLTGIS